MRIRRIVQAFSKYGVRAGHLEAYLGHPIDTTLSDEIADLQGVFNALKEGAKASEFFGDLEAEAKAERIEQAAEAVQQAAQAPTPRRRRSAVVVDLQEAREARAEAQQPAEAAADAESEPTEPAPVEDDADEPAVRVPTDRLQPTTARHYSNHHP